MECCDLHDWGYHTHCACVHYVEDNAEKCFLSFILYQVEICKNDSIGY
jgi:hypothetical protein